jgi:Na+/H+-dicarboxylate symporter
MIKRNLTLRVLIGMILGIATGLLLMTFVPAPIQPADQLKVTLDTGETLMLTVARSDRAEKAVPVVIEDEERGRAILETAQREGFVRFPGGEIQLAGVSFRDAPAVLRTAGLPATQVELDKRSSVTIRPGPTQVVYVLGELFIRLLRMLVIPLILSTVLVGIGSLGDIAKLGRLGRQTFLFYFGTMFLASLTGLFFVNLIRPGVGLNWTVPEDAGTGIVAESPSIVDLILRIVPTNPIQAMAEFDVLGMLFFIILLALAILTVGKQRAAPVFNFAESLSDLIFVLIRWLMLLAPIGVGALIAYYIGIQNVQHFGTLIASLGKFAATVAGSLTVHFLVLLLILRFVGRYNPILFLRQLGPAIMTAFGTNSSSATMPMTLSSVRQMGVSKRISNFVVPVGATMNMDGTALFEAVAVLFFAQAYGFELGFAGQAIVALTAVLAAVGAAGIPSAGLVTMALVLTAVGLPLAGIGLLFAIDRPLDMLRTVVNITGDAVTSRVVQTWNPEIDPADDDVLSEYQIVEPVTAHGD